MRDMSFTLVMLHSNSVVLQIHFEVDEVLLFSPRQTYLPRLLKLVFCTNGIFGPHQKYALNGSIINEKKF